MRRAFAFLAALIACAHADPDRVVAIGDLHGDVDAARRALRLAGAIDGKDRWIGRHLVVVQTGDEIDRNDTDAEVLELFDRLTTDSGGKVIALDGNHELMNVAGDFRYVTKGGFREFGGKDARAEAFSPGGAMAKLLEPRHIFTIVGSTVFVHAGILPEYASRMTALDDEARAWVAHGGDEPEALTDDDGPLWTRFFAGDDDDEMCDVLDKTLAALKVKRMVVAHTVQDDGITSACDGRLWRIDVGLASEYGGPMQLLEITGDHVRVLK
jgi:hypothetical protein